MGYAKGSIDSRPGILGWSIHQEMEPRWTSQCRRIIRAHDRYGLDPVCGMTVDPDAARAKGLTFTHEGVEYAFCGRGCRLEFEDDPATYLSPDHVPSMSSDRLDGSPAASDASV